ncbi:hypothetical protein [Candidatus Hydrogenosomobacter endosymbioticus]|uniref:Soluble cytochrome b562 n=1 Tax=Candidatus Hydrogenosomobacter endosymbioticus TaxID=2558174 RepID=A0ABN6L3K4_9PROT|nr:hypothetical protein [Candidatus Hydrogenosomobacter endosymbioticus]BDB96494.1 hypothetical protein HYD_6270 [Candidatus Hydrogenosomobacter endosymbioticus]
MKKLFLFLFALTTASSAFADEEDFRKRFYELMTAYNEAATSPSDKALAALTDKIHNMESARDLLDVSITNIKRADELLEDSRELTGMPKEGVSMRQILRRETLGE